MRKRENSLLPCKWTKSGMESNLLFLWYHVLSSSDTFRTAYPVDITSRRRRRHRKWCFLRKIWPYFILWSLHSGWLTCIPFATRLSVLCRFWRICCWFTFSHETFNCLFSLDSSLWLPCRQMRQQRDEGVRGILCSMSCVVNESTRGSLSFSRVESTCPSSRGNSKKRSALQETHAMLLISREKDNNKTSMQSIEKEKMILSSRCIRSWKTVFERTILVRRRGQRLTLPSESMSVYYPENGSWK